MSDVRWEDPPAGLRGATYDWAIIGKRLKERPGEWAMVAVCPNSPTAGNTARYIREGKYRALRALGVYDATARTIQGEARVYARYIGETS